MSQQIRIILSFILIGILSFFTQKTNAQPIIRLSGIVWDLKTVKEGPVWEQHVKIRNIGTKELRIHVRVSCDCLTIDPDSFIISPGANRILKILFYTKGYAGQQTKYVYIESNDREHPVVTFLVKANIVSKSLKSVTAPKVISSTDTTKITIPITIFASRNCLFCLELKNDFIPTIKRKYNTEIIVKEYFLDEPANFEKLVMWEKKYGVIGSKIPVVFVGDDVIGGKEEINKRLEMIILKYVIKKKVPPVKIDEEPNIKQEILSRFKNYSIVPIIVAGLLDGINPCAFAVIAFFITYLVFVLNKSKKEVFFIGISFVVGVYLAYLGLGLGLGKVLQSLVDISVIAKIFYLITGITMLVFAVLSFRDAIVIKRLESGEREKVALQLPGFLKNWIHTVIRKQAKMRNFVFFAFFTGVLVSILELACTGQVYLPTIMYIIQISGYNWKSGGYLVLYCLMFIVPLLIVFILIYLGTAIENIRNIGYRYMSVAKVLLGILFVFFAVYMFMVVFKIWV